MKLNVKIEEFDHSSQMAANDFSIKEDEYRKMINSFLADYYLSLKMNQPDSANKFGDEIFQIDEKKPFFDLVLAKSNVKPLYKMGFPEESYPLLPSSKVPAVLTCNSKTWRTTLIGDIERKKFESATWKKFVVDNNLQVDDCLVFQIMESGANEIKFTVQILRGGFPAELEHLVAANTVNID